MFRCPFQSIALLPEKRYCVAPRPLKRCWIPDPAEEACKPKRPCWLRPPVPQPEVKASRATPPREPVRRPRLPKLGYLEVRSLLGSMVSRLRESRDEQAESGERSRELPLRQRALIQATQQWCSKKYKVCEQRLLGWNLRFIINVALSLKF